jgi:hypothetical protein
MQRPLHDKSLRESRLQPPLWASPIQLAFRAILLVEVPRELQTSAGSQQSLLEMALQMSRAVYRRPKIIQRCCRSRTGALSRTEIEPVEPLKWGVSVECLGKSRSHHDKRASDADRSTTRVDTFASCARLALAGHSRHTWPGLERFPAKWTPVRVKKARRIKNLEPRSDSFLACTRSRK